ncbi:hypothetical protein H0H81_007804 [Sphagnurus paluster]|uniref:Uncharacterized protein n=1 Tax=Sphagnurus paluster TaxID=117069 RepID=A0A9P7GJA8_9AGAR|nr:hypothetical protein H0H81_007804 [Sphagnurus paluster]
MKSNINTYSQYVGVIMKGLDNELTSNFKGRKVILICIEHSFWLAQKPSSPTEGFIKALDTFMKEQPGLLDKTLKEYLKLKQSNDWFATKHHPSLNECADFRKIIFDNLLRKAARPKPTV